MKVLILAAGYATRMYPLTLNQPKALLTLDGRTLLDYILDQINTLPEVNEIIVISNHKFYPHFQEWVSSVKSECPIFLLDDGSTTEKNRLGAIGDIDFALKIRKVEEDIIVIAGDNFIDYPLLEQYQFFKEKQADVVCAQQMSDKKALTQLAVATVDSDNKILTLVEKPSEPPSDLAVFATYFYKKETLPMFSEYLQEGQIPDAPGYFLQWLHKKKDVYVYVMNGQCHDIGTVDAYRAMQANLEARSQKKGLRPELKPELKPKIKSDKKIYEDQK